jgi:hypothetical protein
MDAKRRGFLLKVWGKWERHEKEFCERVAEKAMEKKETLEAQGVTIASVRSLSLSLSIEIRDYDAYIF